MKDDVLTDENLIELSFSFVTKSLPVQFTEKTMRLISTESDLNSKIKISVNELKEFVGRGLIATDLEEIFQTIVKRSRIMFEYRAQKKKKFANKLKETLGKKWAKKTGKLFVIKALNMSEVEDLEEVIENSRDIYLLPQNVSFNNYYYIQFVINFNTQLQVSKDTITFEEINVTDIPLEITTEIICNKIIECFK